MVRLGQNDHSDTVDSQRLYQMVCFERPREEHDFEIEFLDPGVEAFSFTFG